MGQKVNPVGFRLGINRNWSSRWFSSNARDVVSNIGEDYEIRKFIKKELYYAGINDIIVERTAKKAKITVIAARPGVIIGKKGVDIERIRNHIFNMIGKDTSINIKEVKKPQISAQLISENIALQLERRVAFRRAMKKVMHSAMKSGAKGIKVKVSGRLAGAEMARTEWYMDGRVPLHTIRAKIDYGFSEATTTFGIIGIKTWVFKGEVLLKGIHADKVDSSIKNNLSNKKKERF